MSIAQKLFRTHPKLIFILKILVPKISSKKFWDPKWFLDLKIFLAPKFFSDENCFWTKNILWAKRLFGLKIFFRTQNFFCWSQQKFSDPKHFLGPENLFTPKSFQTQKFFPKNSINALCQLDQVTRFVSTLPQLWLSLAQLSPSLLSILITIKTFISWWIFILKIICLPQWWYFSWFSALLTR